MPPIASGKFITIEELEEAAKRKEIVAKDSSFVPPESVAKSLEWRKQYGRGMTSVGLARAKQLKNRQKLSLKTIKRMVSYFARQAVDKEANSWKEGHSDGGPSNGKIAWYGWGGDAGRTWANKVAKKHGK